MLFPERRLKLALTEGRQLPSIRPDCPGGRSELKLSVRSIFHFVAANTHRKPLAEWLCCRINEL
jgi:hypothetical protein